MIFAYHTRWAPLWTAAFSVVINYPEQIIMLLIHITHLTGVVSYSWSSRCLTLSYAHKWPNLFIVFSVCRSRCVTIRTLSLPLCSFVCFRGLFTSVFSLDDLVCVTACRASHTLPSFLHVA